MTKHLKVVPLIEKSDDNKTWSARQALEDLLSQEEIDSTKHLLVVYVHELSNGELKLGRLRAGVTRSEEITYLSLALHDEIGDMRT
jgi:hypothetical protein